MPLKATEKAVAISYDTPRRRKSIWTNMLILIKLYITRRKENRAPMGGLLNMDLSDQGSNMGETANW
jgi:hypothetical protein